MTALGMLFSMLQAVDMTLQLLRSCMTSYLDYSSISRHSRPREDYYTHVFKTYTDIYEVS
jgi:hypothetical protein